MCFEREGLTGVGVVVGSVKAFDEGGFAERSMMSPGTDGNDRSGCTVVAVVYPIFATPSDSSTTTEGAAAVIEDVTMTKNEVELLESSATLLYRTV
jgi:hypothetical protein